MTEILFDKISRMLELLVVSPDGEGQRGRLNLTRIYSEQGDFYLQGMGVSSNQEHRFSLSEVAEIFDVESGENVDIGEFRAELMAHLKT
ncbi:MAG: hypothetical protein ABL951_05705 [Alphaproteobacteria bacterium]